MNSLTLSAFIPATAEVWLAVMSCVILLTGLFGEKIKNMPYWLTQITLLISAVWLWYSFAAVDYTATQTFHGTFVLDPLSVLLKLCILVSVMVVFAYSRDYNDERNVPATEFYVLGLLATLGMLVLVSSHNLLTLYLGVELLALPTYAMVAIQRGKARCIEAAMKYFIVGALASGMLLYGLSMLFGATQSLDIAQIASSIASAGAGGQQWIALFALVFILAGVAFKLGAAPFHMWVPDVYDGAPSSVTLFISSAPKLAGFALLIRLLLDAMPALHIEWQHALAVIAVLSIGLGNLVAIVQRNIKRMLAYSSIAHIGYMLLGLAAGNDNGNAAALFYMISYTVMTLGAFGMVALMSRAGFEANDIEDYAGLNTRNPWLAFMMLLILFSLAGIPPLVGFIAKVGILEALIQAHLVSLAVIAILFAIVGAYYYIRVVKVMYFEEPRDTAEVIVSRESTLVMTVNGLAVLVMGIFPGALFHVCHFVF